MSDIFFYSGLIIEILSLGFIFAFNRRQRSIKEHVKNTPARLEEWTAQYRRKRKLIYFIQIAGLILMGIGFTVID